MRQCPKCGSSYADAIAFCPNDGTPTVVPGPAADRDSLLGIVIDGRYRMEQRIGEGGMGVVYRAVHVVLKKPFAIKIMRGEQAHDPDVLQRFVQEARAASGIGHPNIVNISDFGTTPDGTVYLVMEYLAGQTLAEAMHEGPLTQDRALAIFVQIAGALDAAHERGIIHRDLKPENIFLKREPSHPDFVKVLDFGIAKVKNAAAKITRTGMVFGTPHYMSPEQAAGQPVDHRSDIYSLGVIMYQVLAGQLPFDAASFMDLVTKHMYEPPLPLRQAGPSTLELPIALETLVMRSLQKKPEDRPQSMRELQEALQQLQLRPMSDPAPAPVPLDAGRDVGMSKSSTPPAHESHASPGPVGSATLEEAALADVVGFGDDDAPIAVPKKRRSVWIWAVGAGVVLVIALLSMPGPAPEVQPGTVAKEVADAGLVAPPPPTQGAAQLPDGVSAPEPEREPASPQPELKAPAAPSNAKAASTTEPVHAKPRSSARAVSSRTELAPAPGRTAQPQSPRRSSGRAQDEPLDPWR